jgi:hypothetical protein
MSKIKLRYQRLGDGLPALLANMLKGLIEPPDSG